MYQKAKENSPNGFQIANPTDAAKCPPKPLADPDGACEVACPDSKVWMLRGKNDLNRPTNLTLYCRSEKPAGGETTSLFVKGGDDAPWNGMRGYTGEITVNMTDKSNNILGGPVLVPAKMMCVAPGISLFDEHIP